MRTNDTQFNYLFEKIYELVELADFDIDDEDLLEAAKAVIDNLELDERFFLNFKIPSGRGNLLKVKIKKKTINLIDEIGYLESLFSQANIAFIGGSLIPRGGQNFLEALKFSLPISSGESFYNFQEIAEDLIEMDILKVGNSAEKLRLIWEEQLNSVPNQIYEKTDNYLKQRMGASQRAFKHLSL